MRTGWWWAFSWCLDNGGQKEKSTGQEGSPQVPSEDPSWTGSVHAPSAPLYPVSFNVEGRDQRWPSAVPRAPRWRPGPGPVVAKDSRVPRVKLHRGQLQHLDLHICWVFLDRLSPEKDLSIRHPGLSGAASLSPSVLKSISHAISHPLFFCKPLSMLQHRLSRDVWV